MGSNEDVVRLMKLAVIFDGHCCVADAGIVVE